MAIAIAALMRRHDRRNAVSIAICGIDKHRTVDLIEGCSKLRDVQVTASAVAALSNDDVDSSFDVGVILVNGCCDIAVADSRSEMIAERPLSWHASLDGLEMTLNYLRCICS